MPIATLSPRDPTASDLTNVGCILYREAGRDIVHDTPFIDQIQMNRSKGRRVYDVLSIGKPD